jgi:hypothetical protein
MATTLVRQEPLGIVVQDGGEAQTTPRIMMWYWASENDIPEWEKD